MEEMIFGQFVWFEGEGWQYIGMDEDGAIQLCRPIRNHPFRIIEFNQVDVDEFDKFYKENGIKKQEEKTKSHKEKHVLLHRHFDELIADYMSHTKKLFSESSIMDLINWSYKQTEKPTEE